MKRCLVIPLLLLILQRVDSQNLIVGNALPCGVDNLSCLNFNLNDPADCLATDQLCDGTDDCGNGFEEGQEFSNLDCIDQLYRCRGGEVVPLEALCDGHNNCTTGEDETSLICENKCRLPYYGGCDYTRECISSPFSQICGVCLPGLVPGNPSSGPCIQLTIGFSETEYTVVESQGFVAVTVLVLDGVIQSPREVEFSLSTVVLTGDTATAGADFITFSVDHTFDESHTPVTMNISISTDSVVEDQAESFTVRIDYLPMSATDMVTVSPQTATVFIIDAPVPCPNRVEIDNGMVTFTGNLVGDTASYTCDMSVKAVHVLCPNPPDIDNGTMAFTGNSIGDTATYTCDSGFVLIGDATTECMQVDANSATFQPAPPSCRPPVPCPSPVEIDNGMVTFTGNLVGDTASYTCDMGFELIGGAATTCTQVDANSATFQPAPPSCRPLCADPPDIDNGTMAFTGNSVGDTATYTCDSGFVLIGGATTECMQVDANSATFQPAPPSCRLITIGFNQSEYSVLESQGFVTVTVLILDGKIRSPRVVEFSLSTVVLIGDTAEAGKDFRTFSKVHTFDESHTPVTMNISIIIDSVVKDQAETFTLRIDRLPMSATDMVTVSPQTATVFIFDAPVPCPNPVEIDNGMVTFTGNLDGDTASYTCDMGFELIGVATTTCTQVDANSATFQPAPPSCRPLCPDPPNIDNGIMAFTGNSIGDTATYTCDSGFVLIGDATTECIDANSATFTPAPPSCRLELCTDGELRLRGRSTLSEGRVEICFKQTWGTVCDDQWDMRDAVVVCRQLGLPTAGAQAFESARFGEGVDPIFLDEVRCSGTEISLTQCLHEGIGMHDCTHGEDAGVICSGRDENVW